MLESVDVRTVQQLPAKSIPGGEAAKEAEATEAPMETSDENSKVANEDSEVTPAGQA